MSADAVEIKGEMTLLSVLQIASSDLAKIKRSLKAKVDSSPQLFAASPVVVDCVELGEACGQLDLPGLRELITTLGFVPVGLRNIPEAQQEAAISAGWAILRSPARANVPPRVERPVNRSADATRPSVEVIERPVRSGQQVYFPDGDIVVLQHTSAGSEILAGGSVHVYGSLRGRVLAGINGDTTARIFCQKLEAELVAIAGTYRLLDEVETDLKGQPAMVWLDGEKLKIAPMF